MHYVLRMESGLVVLPTVRGICDQAVLIRSNGCKPPGPMARRGYNYVADNRAALPFLPITVHDR